MPYVGALSYIAMAAKIPEFAKAKSHVAKPRQTMAKILESSVENVCYGSVTDR
jgi:hypothetical protein